MFDVAVLQPGQEMTDISIVLRDLENFNNDIKVAARKVSVLHVDFRFDVPMLRS